jgi:hypothetical protein
MQSIDPIKPASRPPSPRETSEMSRPARQQPQSALPQSGARFTKLQPKGKKKRGSRDIIIALLVSPILLGLSLAGVFGMALVAVYGIVAIIRRLNSRVSFVLALSAFVYMFALQLAAMAAWAQTAAVLAYVLLTIGVISLAFETRRSRGMWSKKQ